jgi:hypothetical protein
MSRTVWFRPSCAGARNVGHALAGRRYLRPRAGDGGLREPAGGWAAEALRQASRAMIRRARRSVVGPCSYRPGRGGLSPPVSPVGTMPCATTTDRGARSRFHRIHLRRGPTVCRNNPIRVIRRQSSARSGQRSPGRGNARAARRPFWCEVPPSIRRLHVQAPVRSAMVATDVLTEHVLRVTLAAHDDVVQAVPPKCRSLARNRCSPGAFAATSPPVAGRALECATGIRSRRWSRGRGRENAAFSPRRRSPRGYAARPIRRWGVLSLQGAPSGVKEADGRPRHRANKRSVRAF